MKELGAELTTIKAALTAGSLSKVNLLLISDPDTAAESKDPKYLTEVCARNLFSRLLYPSGS